MIYILFHPCVNEFNTLRYEIKNKVVSIFFDGELETVDFNGLPDGELQEITSKFTFKPILGAKIENGELHIELVNFIKPDAPQEKCFPSWVGVEEWPQ